MLATFKNYDLREFYDSDNDEWHYFDYTTYDVVLEVDGHRYNAFGCGSSKAHVPPGERPGNAYPYREMTCWTPEECQYMAMMPVWFCSWCEVCDDYMDGDWYDCKYSIHPGNSGNTELEDFPKGYKPDNMSYYTAYI